MQKVRNYKGAGGGGGIMSMLGGGGGDKGEQYPNPGENTGEKPDSSNLAAGRDGFAKSSKGASKPKVKK